jgi:hypothetical protein
METQHFVLQLSNDGALTIATLYSQLLSTENDFYQLLRMRIRDMVGTRLRCCVDPGWWLRAQFREMRGRLQAARKVQANMARNSACLKMSSFPLPEAQGRKVRSLLESSGSCSVIDPCAGRGTALNLIHGWCASASIWGGTRHQACGGNRNDRDPMGQQSDC